MRAAACACALLLTACGAKTGLRLPDASLDAFAPDAGADAGHDAGPPPCIEVPLDAGPVNAQLGLPVTLRDVDVMFVIDGTGSIQHQVATVATRLRSVVLPGIQAALPDAWLGLAYSGEFPVRPYGPDGIHPYGLVLPVSADSLALEAPLGVSPNWRNRDVPEAQVEAVYQAITGEGLGRFVDASFGCASGGHGGACFRDTALSVVVLIADAPMHNGPAGVPPSAPYDPSRFAPDPAPHEYADLLRVATDARVRVVTIGIHHSGQPDPFPHLTRLSQDTGAVTADGRVLTFDAGSDGSAIDTEIVGAIQALADGLPVDVTARVEDVTGDAFDARTLVRAVRPLAADPPSGATSIDETAFHGVRPGTRVTFTLTIDASSLPPSRVTRHIPARVVFLADGRSALGSVTVDLLIPGDDGMHCPRETTL